MWKTSNSIKEATYIFNSILFHSCFILFIHLVIHDCDLDMVKTNAFKNIAVKQGKDIIIPLGKENVPVFIHLMNDCVYTLNTLI